MARGKKAFTLHLSKSKKNVRLKNAINRNLCTYKHIYFC